MRAGARSGTCSRCTLLRKRPWASFAGSRTPIARGLPGVIRSSASGTQIQWPRQRISEKSCGVTCADKSLSLHGPGGQPCDNLPLEEQEHDERQDRNNKHVGEEQVPLR